MNEQERGNEIIRLRKQAFELVNLKKVSSKQRQLLVRYVKMELEDAKRLSKKELYRWGPTITHGLNGVIAVQDWLKDEDDRIRNTEPEFAEILSHSGPLELENYENGYTLEEIEEEWQALFEAADKLK